MSKEEKTAMLLGISLQELKWLVYCYKSIGMSDYQITAEFQRQIDEKVADMRGKE